MTSMDFGSNLDGSGTFVSPYWPLVVAHRIDQGSPLYSLAPRDMKTQHFEVVCRAVNGTFAFSGHCGILFFTSSDDI